MGANIGGLIGDYGAVPQGFQDKYGLVTPEMREMSARNPFSFVKQNERKRKRSLGSMYGNRADRGVIQSGGTALQAGDIEYDSGLANYSALRDISSNIGSLYSGYADNVRGRFDQQSEGYGDAVNRLLDAGFSPQRPVVGPGRKRKPRYPTLGPRNSGPLIGVNQGTAPYIGTRP
jgi:hypothetical protein